MSFRDAINFMKVAKTVPKNCPRAEYMNEEWIWSPYQTLNGRENTNSFTLINLLEYDIVKYDGCFYALEKP